MFRLSNSSATVARSCWKKFEWMYIHNLSPITQPIGMQLGKILHQAFDMYYNDFDEQEVEDYIVLQCDELIKEADPYKQEDFQIAKYIALGAWNYFPKEWRDEYDEVQSEIKFHIPLTKDVDFCGIIDGLVKKDGKWFIRELKSTGLSFPQFERKANISPQVTGYVYALRKMGIEVKGIMYDFIKKPLLRKNINDTVDTYCARIVQDYAKRPQFYFHRHFTYRSDMDIKLYEQDLKQLAEDITDRIKSKKFYRNPNNCLNYNTECPYKKVCFDEKPDPLTLKLYFKQYERKEFTDARRPSGK